MLKDPCVSFHSIVQNCKGYSWVSGIKGDVKCYTHEFEFDIVNHEVKF